MAPRPRVVDLADLIFDVVASDGPSPPTAQDALEALMLAACCYGRQCRASEDGMRRLFASTWKLAVEGLPDFRVELVDTADILELHRKEARR